MISLRWIVEEGRPLRAKFGVLLCVNFLTVILFYSQ